MNYFDNIKEIWEAVSIYEGPEVYLRNLKPFPKKLVHVFAVHWLESEVCNGGFHQFFSNSTGIVAPEALQGLHAIGEEDLFTLANEAVSQLGKPFPRDRDERNEKLDLLAKKGDKRKDWDPFYHLDSKWYVAHKSLTESIEKYLKA